MRLAALALLVSATVAFGQGLNEKIKARLEGFRGTVSIYAKNLDTGEVFALREKEGVRTASTIKLPIMVAVFDAVAREKASWDEKLIVRPQDKVAGSGVIGSELSDGVQLPLRDVVNLMIVVSDNTATNMLLERFSADTVNTYLDSIGIEDTRSLRKVRGDGIQLKAAEGWSEAGKRPENQKYGLGVSTAHDMGALLEKLEKGELVSPSASKAMLSILARCQDMTGIRRRLKGLRIANKTGALDALRSDIGIVYTPGGRVVLAITVDGLEKPDYGPENPGSILISELAQILVMGLSTDKT